MVTADELKARSVFVTDRLTEWLACVDGAKLGVHSVDSWDRVTIPRIDKVTGFTHPTLLTGMVPSFGRGVLFRFCPGRIAISGRTLPWSPRPTDVAPVGIGTSPTPYFDDLVRVIFDLLAGETLAMIRNADEPEMRNATTGLDLARRIAEDDLEARIPGSMQLLSTVQTFALGDQ